MLSGGEKSIDDISDGHTFQLSGMRIVTANSEHTEKS